MAEEVGNANQAPLQVYTGRQRFTGHNADNPMLYGAFRRSPGLEEEEAQIPTIENSLNCKAERLLCCPA